MSTAPENAHARGSDPVIDRPARRPEDRSARSIEGQVSQLRPAAERRTDEN